MKTKIWLAGWLGLISLLLTAGLAAAAQDGSGLDLRVVKNIGYGGLGKIQGQFTLKIANPPANLKEVVFYLDGEVLARAEEPPFEVQFHTGDFQPGEHRLWARGALADGSQLESNFHLKTFLSSDQAWQETQGILVPLLVGVGLLTLIGLGVPMLLSGKKDFVVGRYGMAGGSVCPRCSLPFSRPALGPNLLVGKLMRCPHCGKISVLPRASAAELQKAEKKYHAADQPPVAGDRQKALSKLLENSRFED